VPVGNTTSKNLANAILEILNSLSINPKYIVGQGYDGAAAMSGNLNGIQANHEKIKKLFTKLYRPRTSHRLS
jgi:hypothetical protein